MEDTRKKAKVVGDRFYFTGKPCLRGHLSKRHSDSGTCAVCKVTRREEKSDEINLQNDIYYKTKRGKITSLFNHMKARCTERHWKRYPSYTGRTCNISKEDFFRWVINESDFDVVYLDWVESGYRRNLTPTVDRINNKGDYIINNIQILSLRDNLSKGVNDE